MTLDMNALPLLRQMDDIHRKKNNNFEAIFHSCFLLFYGCRGLKKRQKFSLWRQKFMASLQTIGLEIEEVSVLAYFWLGNKKRRG